MIRILLALISVLIGFASLDKTETDLTNSERVQEEERKTIDNTEEIDPNLIDSVRIIETESTEEEFVEITLPAEFFPGNSQEEYLKGSESLEGVIESRINEDRSVTQLITKEYQEMTLRVTDYALYEMIKSMEEDPERSILSSEYKDDMSEFNLFVDPTIYSEGDLYDAFIIESMASRYRIYSQEKDYNVIINIINNDTEELIESLDSEDIASLIEFDYNLGQ